MSSTNLPTKILFPAPPPTTNSLTAAQRMQLMRSTKKLGRILGATPHLIDTSNSNVVEPLHIHLPFSTMDLSSQPRASTDSVSSRSSLTSLSSSASLERSSSSCSSAQSLHSMNSRPGSLRSRRSIQSGDSSNSWSSRKPPMLRLALASPLETIPASPLSAPSVYTHRRSSSICGYTDLRFTLRVGTPPSESPESSPTSPVFSIPSSTAERRRKMERLRRKLGEDVPHALVFPADESDDATSASSEPSPVSPIKALPALPPSPPRKPRIVHTRDSMASLSPHRAPRTFIAPKASRPAPPPPMPVLVPSPTRPHRHAEQPQVQRGRLGVIIESPDEHGAGCAQEFGRGRAGSESPPESEWYGSDGEAEMQLWSTRRGYGGWTDRAVRPPSYRKAPPVW